MSRRTVLTCDGCHKEVEALPSTVQFNHFQCEMNYDACSPECLGEIFLELAKRFSPAGKQTATQAALQSQVNEMMTWLSGLEGILCRTLSDSRTTAEERAVMTNRRGIYVGIADDIRRKWGGK